MADDHQDEGLRHTMRRAVGDALDATVGRVSHSVGEAAVDFSGATAQQIIEEIEPYLIDEAVPRIVDGVTPYLIDSVVPLVVDGVQSHLVDVTVPQVLAGVTPQLVEEILPQLLSELRPYLERDLVPEILDALMPRIRDEVAPDLVDALMPKIRDEVAPDLVDALMPRIEAEVAPRLVDALMPKIRNEVVPIILDDIVDDPSVRDLIREQSQGLFLDALESLRENLADADDLAERFGRRLFRKPPRPEPESAVTLVLDATGGGQAVPLRRTLDDLAEQRRTWQAMPMPPAPPGREFAHAGVVTRLLGLALDLALTSWLISQGLSALVSLLDSLLSPIPSWATLALTVMASVLVPIYLTVCWWLVGRTIGSWLMGTRVCTPDGLNPGFWRSLVRALVLLVGLVLWILTGFISLFDAKRRLGVDLLLHTEVRYVVPDNQQHRYIREAVQARRAQASPRAASAASEA